MERLAKLLFYLALGTVVGTVLMIAIVAAITGQVMVPAFLQGIF